MAFIIESIINKTNKEAGIIETPGFVLDLNSRLKDLNLHYYKKGVDRLHNIKGFGERLFHFFSKEPYFNEKLEKDNLKRYLYIEDHSRINGYLWRLYYVYYQKILLPSIVYKREEAEQIIKYFLEIQQLSYKGIFDL